MWKWNSYINYIVKSASRRIYMILYLKRARCSDDILFSVYAALIRPILLYAYPVVCNMSLYLRNQLLRVENRVLRIINSDRKFPTLFSVGDNICQKMFARVVTNDDHPLREFFLSDSVRRLRIFCPLRMPRTKTERYKNSFLKYCK